MADEVEAAVRAAIAEVAGPEAARLGPEARFAEDMRIDSLDFVQVVQGVEERLGIRTDDEDLGAIRTLGQLLAVATAARTSPGEAAPPTP